jgi:chloramphenicol 3-O-phosphotransferase
MGIRALLEQVMIMQVGDIGGFDKKLDAFQERGFISSIQRHAMRATLDVGDAAVHRAFVPKFEDLNTCLDIVEGVMSVIYSHREEAERISAAVPPRKPKLRPV